MDYKIASVATKWWIDQMKQQCKKLYPNKVTGDNSNLVIVDESLQNELSRFEEILFKKIYHHVTFKCYLLLQNYLKRHLSVIYIVDFIECNSFCISLNIQKLQMGKIKKVYIGVIWALYSFI